MALILPGAFHGLSDNAYPADRVRRTLQAILGDSEGVIGTADMQVSATTPASMSVQVAAGRAWINGDASARQGSYLEENDATVTVGPAGAAHATLPRIDRVVLQERDADSLANQGGGDATDDAEFLIIAGTPADPAVAPGVPPSAVSLATLSIPAAATSIAAAQITDKRRNAVRALHARVARAAAQSIPNVALTAILFDTALDNVDGMWVQAASAAAVFAPSSGLYAVQTSVTFGANGTGGRYVELQHAVAPSGATTEIASARVPASTDGTTRVPCSMTVRLAAADAIVLAVSHTAGVAVNATAFMAVSRLGV